VAKKHLMDPYQHEFLEFAIDCGVLRFGQFTLKSGRTSPYFFNAGLFNRGTHLAHLGRYYAAAVTASGIDFDVLFGPAYKGIPLVVALSIALADHYGRDVPICFNRKEAKVHGEGGSLVGAQLAGRALIVDDVITAGTAIRESLQIIEAAGARAAGVLVSLDRKEKGQHAHSAIQEIEQMYGIPVISIVSLDNLLEFLSRQPGRERELDEIRRYQARYGV
jgi:orotate phosphoribosyltransferase